VGEVSVVALAGRDGRRLVGRVVAALGAPVGRSVFGRGWFGLVSFLVRLLPTLPNPVRLSATRSRSQTG